ncbi:MAG: hypothetical protein JXR59_08160 [Desulfuromonadaceae bacterium]|nr:hypothetical protein [Desulfuromonadaceae bacterium]
MIKRLVLHTNDPQQREVPLIVTATVQPELNVGPRQLRWDNLAAGSTAEGTIAVENTSDHPVTLTVRGTTPAISVGPVPQQVAAGETLAVAIQVSQTDGTSQVSGYVLVESQGLGRSSQRVAVIARFLSAGKP